MGCLNCSTTVSCGIILKGWALPSAKGRTTRCAGIAVTGTVGAHLAQPLFILPTHESLSYDIPNS